MALPAGGAGLVLRGDRVTLRPATEGDLPRLAPILESPEVAAWWVMPTSSDELRRDIFADDISSYVVEVAGQTAGLLQCHEETTPGYRSAGLDIALAPAHQGQGLGVDALRTMARYLFDERGHHRLTIDPATANEHAISCYRKVGFKPVGVMRQYEQGADSTWHDGLLMDLLRDELA